MSPADGGPPPRLLVAEDEGLVAAHIKLVFERLGAQVIGPFGRLPDLLEAAESEEMDGAVLDINLSGKDVFEAAEILRRRGIPFVFHSGHGSRKETAVSFPGATFFAKPAPPSDLFEALVQNGQASEGPEASSD